MKGPVIRPEQVKPMLETPFLRVVDLQYADGKHYYNATRRPSDQLPCVRNDEDFRRMLPDAVTCAVVIRTPDAEPRLLMSREYRYPAGRFLLSPPAGLLDPGDSETENPVLTAARREIREETGIAAEPTRLEIVSPLLFSTPGMSDESNALALAVYDLPDLSALSQEGAVGSECFDGFQLLTSREARQILRRGVDERGVYYSVFTWACLAWFVSGLWEA